MGILLSTAIGFLLLGMIWTWHLTGTLEFTPGGILSGKASSTVIGVLLALYAFGTGKAALMPFHRWLPAAMVAPTPRRKVRRERLFLAAIMSLTSSSGTGCSERSLE